MRGNHDKVIADLESSSLFNPAAAFSAEWSKLNISPANLQYLKKLPKGPQIIDRFITICHGSTFDEDYYVFSQFEATESFSFMETSIGFFGHTHFPIIYYLRNEKIDVVPLSENTRIKLDRQHPLPDQPRLDRPAARQEPGSEFRHFRLGQEGDQFHPLHL